MAFKKIESDDENSAAAGVRRRSKEYRERQLAMGRKLRSVWMSDEEMTLVQNMLKVVRLENVKPT